MMSCVAGHFWPVFGSVQGGMCTRVSRGMLTTDMLVRSADRWAIMITSARSPVASLAPPSAASSALSRLSDPRIRMFIALVPSALAFGFATPLWPLTRCPLRILPDRYS
jgi:hypothetical protein